MTNIKDDKNVLADLRNGSFKAFEAIYNTYSGKLYNFILTISKRDKYMAEEIVQSTFIKLWEVHEQIDPQHRILSYLSKIAKNLLFNKYKRQTVEYVYQEYFLNKQTDHDNTTENEIDFRWLDKFINELIEQLPPSRKKIFILKKKEDRSTKEIAEMMSISVSTVETQLSLAMKYIRSEFEKNSDKLFYLALLVNII